jgi:hypothetical protein
MCVCVSAHSSARLKFIDTVSRSMGLWVIHYTSASARESCEIVNICMWSPIILKSEIIIIIACNMCSMHADILSLLRARGQTLRQNSIPHSWTFQLPRVQPRMRLQRLSLSLSLPPIVSHSFIRSVIVYWIMEICTICPFISFRHHSTRVVPDIECSRAVAWSVEMEIYDVVSFFFSPCRRRILIE